MNAAFDCIEEALAALTEAVGIVSTWKARKVPYDELSSAADAAIKQIKEDIAATHHREWINGEWRVVGLNPSDTAKARRAMLFAKWDAVRDANRQNIKPRGEIRAELKLAQRRADFLRGTVKAFREKPPAPEEPPKPMKPAKPQMELF